MLQIEDSKGIPRLALFIITWFVMSGLIDRFGLHHLHFVSMSYCSCVLRICDTWVAINGVMNAKVLFMPCLSVGVFMCKYGDMIYR